MQPKNVRNANRQCGVDSIARRTAATGSILEGMLIQAGLARPAARPWRTSSRQLHTVRKRALSNLQSLDDVDRV